MFNWFRIFNLTEFLSMDLTSYEITVVLAGIGEKKILITQGNLTSITYDGDMLPINLNDKNPYRYGERGVWLDENDDVWLGVFSAS